MKEATTGTDAEAMEGGCLLAHSQWLALLSYRTKDHHPRDGTIHNGQGPPPSSTN